MGEVDENEPARRHDSRWDYTLGGCRKGRRKIWMPLKQLARREGC
jgi:hypothetical protein